MNLKFRHIARKYVKFRRITSIVIGWIGIAFWGGLLVATAVVDLYRNHLDLHVATPCLIVAIPCLIIMVLKIERHIKHLNKKKAADFQPNETAHLVK